MRMRWVVVFGVVAFFPVAGSTEPVGPQKQLATPITVYKSPSCGCCAGWVDYLRAEGFRVTVVDQYDIEGVKAKHGIGPSLRSCHTAIVDDYVIEGHVPANDIWRLLTERPDVTGLTAPGMPQMSPGMLSIEPRGYDVLTFDEEGETTVFSRY